MSRPGSLRCIKLVADNMLCKRSLKTYFSICPPRRRVSSSNTNAQTALVSLPSSSSNSSTAGNSHAEADARQWSQWTRPTAFSSVGGVASFVHTREAPSFGVAKDRSPVCRSRSRRNEVHREDTIIRHDAVFLKKCSSSIGIADHNRKYKQTWKEFSQKRVRPATEWGYFGAPK